jgi:hypothetical protein
MRVLILLCLSLCVSACNPLANTLSLAVTDDTGKPVANASVTLRWTTNEPWGPSTRSGDPHSLTATTDSHGRASARISEGHYVSITVTHPQHYMSSVAVVDSGLSQHTTSATALPIPLKRIIAPRPLIAKRAYIVLPSLSGEAAYDFVVGDLVRPHGKGSSPDAWFVWTRAADSSTLEERRSWDFAFRAPGSGIIARLFNSDSSVVKSALLSDHSAPGDGYLPSLRSAESVAGFGERGAWSSGALYYFRVSRGDTSLHGTIVGEEPRITFYTDNPRPVVQFTYVLNPSADRSLEPDPKATTFPEANRYEQPFKLPNGT